MASKADPTDIVSVAAQLQQDANVCGSGAPSHTLDRPAQNYTDNDSGSVYTWWAGTWTHQ